MSDILAPLLPEYSLQIPEKPGVLIVWILWLILSGFLALRLKKQSFLLNRRNLAWFAGLSLSILFFTPFFGIDPILGNAAVSGSLPFNHLMFLAAIPWMVAGGILGVLPGTMLAGISGLLLAYLDSHHLFTPLIFISISLVYVWGIRQNYRTILFNLLRSPFIAAIFSLITAIPLILFAQALTIDGPFIYRLAVAFGTFPENFISLGGMVIIGGIAAVFVKKISGAAWGLKEGLKPSPFEISLAARWIGIIIPLLSLLWIFGSFLTWQSAENKARESVVKQLTNTANQLSEDMTLFLETGELLLVEISEESRSLGSTPEVFVELIESQTLFSSFFEKVGVLNANGEFISTYPLESREDFQTLDVALLAQKDPIDQNESFLVHHQDVDDSTRILFLTHSVSTSGQFTGWLVGEVDLVSNSFARQIYQTMDFYNQNSLSIALIADDRLILYPSDPGQSPQFYSGDFFSTATYFEKNDPDGHQMLHYFQPTQDRTLAFVVSVPELLIKEMAFESATPFFLGGFALIILTALVLTASWSPIGKKVLQWAFALDQMNIGEIDNETPKQPLKGELGRLSASIENLIGAFRSRFEKQSDLFAVNKEITGSLSLKESLDTIMKAALVHKVSSVRILIAEKSEGEIEKDSPQFYGMGKHAHFLAALDQDVLSRVQDEGEIILTEFQAGKIFELSKGSPYPASLIALPLVFGEEFFGTLWVTYQDLRSPSDEEISYFRALAQKASRTIRNIRDFNQSITIKRRFEKIMNDLPDAVFLVGQDGRLVYHNSSAKKLFERITLSLDEKTFSRMMINAGLGTFVNGEISEPASKEVLYNDDIICQVTVNPLWLNGLQDERMIIIRDITQQREKESKKSEYVTTVSHELRSPLTLIQGYAKILRMTGNLNEQQDDYINNIIEGAEEMKSLVQNLLDIGRLEGGEPMEFSQIFAADLVKKVADSMSAQAKQKNITLGVDSCPESTLIEGDATFLRQALKNLVDNGIKFTRMGGEVQIAVHDEGDSVTFSVRDNGSGISPLDQRHVFEKFNRSASGAGEKQKGSGLGLAIVRSIAEHHGGKVWFESKLGNGSTFYLRIPKNSNMK